MAAHNEPVREPVQVTGLVQGLVIGDHNTVTQHFNTVKHEAYVAREPRALPASWIERAALATQAESALKPGTVVALVGMGGAGKSTLAAHVAATTALRFSGGTFWIDLAAGDIDEALLRIALAFGHDLSPLKSREARAQTARSLLNGKAVLLVLDDARGHAELAAFLPPPAGCAALLTTRDDALAAGVADSVITIDALAPADAVALLATLTGAPATEPALARIAQALGGLPLALELAGKLARQQARRPGFAWPAFAAGLADSSSRLSLGLAGKSVRAAFDATWTRALNSDVQRAFSLLGVFEPGNLSTAEAAAAWDANEAQALAHLNALIDLSLVQWVDAVTLRLHPLLADYAHEMAQGLSEDERAVAHCRVADHLYQRAPRPPVTLSDMAIVLRSHRHAAAAGDAQRAKRVFPWFNNGKNHVAVPGFLIDHGQLHTLATHHQLKLKYSNKSNTYVYALNLYDVGDALHRVGELSQARDYFQQCIARMQSPDVDDNARTLSLSKMLLALGQTQAALGELENAEATFRKDVEFNRQQDAAGGVIGALAGALIALLQLADATAQSPRPDAIAQAEKICRDVFTEAVQHGDANIAVMALTRLARHAESKDPQGAHDHILQGLNIISKYADVFVNRDGARYARLLGESAKTLAFNGESTLNEALWLLRVAISNAGRSDARQELGFALYQLGNLFEHYHLLDREAPLTAAWACYALSEAYTQENEGGSPLNAQARIDTRIVPRIDATQRDAAAAAVKADPWGTIDAALTPYTLDWRPTS